MFLIKSYDQVHMEYAALQDQPKFNYWINYVISQIGFRIDPTIIPQKYRHLAVPTVAAVQSKSKSSSNEIKANKRANQS